MQTPLEEYDRGAGQVVGEWEKLDGSEDVRVTAKTEVRLIAVDRAAYEAALDRFEREAPLQHPPPPLPQRGEHDRQQGEHEQ